MLQTTFSASFAEGEHKVCNKEPKEDILSINVKLIKLRTAEELQPIDLQCKLLAEQEYHEKLGSGWRFRIFLSILL